MKKKTHYYPVGTIPKSSRKIVKTGKIDTSNTDIPDRSLFWLSTGTSINSGGLKLV